MARRERESVTWLYVLTTILVVWLSALTVMTAALLRHVGVLQLGVEARGLRSGESFDVDADGPQIGSEVPEGVFSIFTAAGVELDDSDAVGVFLSSTCGPCWERASDIIAQNEDLTRTTFIVTGSSPSGLQRLRDLFASVSCPVIYDPEAKAVADELGIHSTPFAFRFEGGKVTGKAYIRSGDDYASLVLDPTVGKPTASPMS